MKIIYSSAANNRVLYGIGHLVNTLKRCGYTVFIVKDSMADLSEPSICVGKLSDSFPCNFTQKKIVSIDNYKLIFQNVKWYSKW